VHITPRLVYSKILFSVLKIRRAWHSGVSLGGMYSCDWERFCPHGWGMRVKQCTFVSFLDTVFHFLCQFTLVIWKAEISGWLTVSAILNSNVRFLGDNEIPLSLDIGQIIALLYVFKIFIYN